MKNILKSIIIFTLVCLTQLAYAQTEIAKSQPEMADLMRSNGKIYVVVAVLAIILAGVEGYLIWINKKISNIEKSNVKN